MLYYHRLCADTSPSPSIYFSSPGDMLNDGGEVGWSVQLDLLQATVVRLQDTPNTRTVRVALGEVLNNKAINMSLHVSVYMYC